MAGGFLEDVALLLRLMMIQTCAEVFNKHSAAVNLHSHFEAKQYTWSELSSCSFTDISLYINLFVAADHNISTVHPPLGLSLSLFSAHRS